MKKYITNTRILIGVFSILYVASIIYSKEILNAIRPKALLYILGFCGLFLIVCGILEVKGIIKRIL